MVSVDNISESPSHFSSLPELLHLLTALPLQAILFVPSKPQSDVNSSADCSGLQSTVREGSSVSRQPPGPIAHDGTEINRFHSVICICLYVRTRLYRWADQKSVFVCSQHVVCCNSYSRGQSFAKSIAIQRSTVKFTFLLLSQQPMYKIIHKIDDATFSYSNDFVVSRKSVKY